MGLLRPWRVGEGVKGNFVYGIQLLVSLLGSRKIKMEEQSKKSEENRKLALSFSLSLMLLCDSQVTLSLEVYLNKYLKVYNSLFQPVC